MTKKGRAKGLLIGLKQITRTTSSIKTLSVVDTNLCKTKSNSDAGNRTPSCCVRDSDVNHYTTSDVVEGFPIFSINNPTDLKQYCIGVFTFSSLTR